MFSFFKRKEESFSLPEITDELRAIERETVNWCRSQIGEYLGGVPQSLPDFGLDHDVLVGSYACGFMQGQFIVTGLLDKWAKKDEGVASLGFSIMASTCLGSTLGKVDRAIRAMEFLPQLGPVKGGTGTNQMDEMGGWDGMAHAKGEPKQKGGLLRFYLENNIQ
jgi:hypothetical protein